MEEKKTEKTQAAAAQLQSLMGSGNLGIVGNGNVVNMTVIAAPMAAPAMPGHAPGVDADPRAGDACAPDAPDAPVPELMALYKSLKPKEREGVVAFMRREFQTGRIDSLDADARQRLLRYLKACLRNRSGAKTNSKGKT